MPRIPVLIPVNGLSLQGEIVIPRDPQAIIIFSHGSGSSRLSPRNRFVAEHLNDAGFATLLFDLLSSEEEQFLRNRFDIDLLSARLITVTEWVKKQPSLEELPIGYFGASTGAASAIRAAAAGASVYAVVSRGGRPDLAGEALSSVEAATLLIVGSHDPEVLELNRRALRRMLCPKELKVIEGASHLFEEGDTLSEVCRHATKWFEKHLPVAGRKTKKQSYVPR
ncbi:MAG TPA: dienelactone hydrolase family protein [Chitinophagaceae bacterium]